MSATSSPARVRGLGLIALAAVSWGTTGSVTTLLVTRAEATPLVLGADHDRGAGGGAARRASDAAPGAGARARRGRHRVVGGGARRGNDRAAAAQRRDPGTRRGTRLRALRRARQGCGGPDGAAAAGRAHLRRGCGAHGAGAGHARRRTPAGARMAVASLPRRGDDSRRVRALHGGTPARPGVGGGRGVAARAAHGNAAGRDPLRRAPRRRRVGGGGAVARRARAAGSGRAALTPLLRAS